jgi:signal transduction histidine kinase
MTDAINGDSEKHRLAALQASSSAVTKQTRLPGAGVSSNRLKEHAEKILSLWEERILEEVASAGKAPSYVLRNSLPLYLNNLSEALAANRKMDFKSLVAQDQEATSIGKQHGADRAGSKNYALTEVISEYHILREIIFQVLEKDGPLDVVQRDIILDSIEQAVNDAAVEFSDVHEDIRQKFVNILTHDLKTPITAAKLNAQMISRRSDLPDSCTKTANKITGSMNRLESMIEDLLDASRLRAGEQLSLQFVPCDLNEVVREVVDEVSAMYGDRFILDSKETLKGNWGCDGLRRAIENLLGNAAKYGSPETPITISLNRGKTAVEIIVHNEGSPIAKDEVPFLFEQYRRSKRVQEGTKTGWGLGLTLVKGVVDAHKGKIRIESVEGKGTSFILEIPLTRASTTVSDAKNVETGKPVNL